MIATFKKAAVIGAGAAGMTAAGRLLANGNEVVLIERMEKSGLKLGITGKGRCNLTNNCDIREFASNIVHNPKFMLSSLSSFSPADTMELFESLGVKLKTERGNRVFPVSDKALDIVYALRNYCHGCTHIRGKAKEVTVSDGRVTGVVLEDGRKISCDAVIIATGGKSYPQTGSDGSGYAIASGLGHRIVDIEPSLVPIVCKEKWCADLQGLSLKNISVSLYENGKKEYEDFGEMIFTHFGISGPVVLSMSGHMSPKKEYKIIIDMKPALDEETLDARIQSDFRKYVNKNFENSLSDLLPRKMIPVVVELSGIDRFKKVNSITKAERTELVRLIKNLTLTFKSFRPIEEAIITRGGVDTKEINPKTMESKLVKDLYFAGEIIDVDAYTGGFSLQIAFSTAMAAAEGIIDS